MVATLISIIAFMVIGCQSGPTKVFNEQRDTIDAPLPVGGGKPVEVNESTVVLDARTAFEYNLARIPGSARIDWQEFVIRSSSTTGLLRNDIVQLQARLARLGIKPESSVVVVGKGLSGKGEEGRVAWTLKYLGVRSVSFSGIRPFKKRLKSEDRSQGFGAVAPWSKPVVDSLRMTPKQFMKVVDKAPSRLKIIDVRSDQEFFKLPLNSVLPLGVAAKVIHIPWQEFLDDNGQVQESISSRLLGVGIRSSDLLVVMSHTGVRSAAVTLALRQLGFSDTRNFDAGYAHWARMQ